MLLPKISKAIGSLIFHESVDKSHDSAICYFINSYGGGVGGGGGGGLKFFEGKCLEAVQLAGLY